MGIDINSTEANSLIYVTPLLGYSTALYQGSPAEPTAPRRPRRTELRQRTAHAN
jgi:hypothetical protein